MNEMTRTRAVPLKVAGLLLLAFAATELLALFGVRFPWQKTRGFPGEAHTVFIWGLGAVSGWAAFAYSAIGIAALGAAGVQLFRVRRSGWILAVALLLLAGLSLSAFILTGQVERQAEAFLERTYPATEARIGRLLVSVQISGSERVYRALWFMLAAHVAVLLFIGLEWWRFWPPRGWRMNKAWQWAKAGACAAFVVLSGLWLFGGAQRVAERAVLRKVQDPNVPIALEDDEVNRLSFRGRRDLTAALVRRMAAHDSQEAAEAFRRFWVLRDLAHLTAEDIPPLLAAARSEHPEVRRQTYRFLARIATPEAESVLRDAVEREREDDGFHIALGSLAAVNPYQLPKALEERPEGVDEDQYRRQVAYFLVPKAEEMLIAALDGEDFEARYLAIPRLQSHPGKRAERAMLGLLADQSAWFRFRACHALMHIGTAESIPALVGMLKAPDEYYTFPDDEEGEAYSLHDAAARALETITGMDFGTDAEAWEAWWEEAGPTFDLRGSFAERLLAPLTVEPPKEITSLQMATEHPYMVEMWKRVDVLRRGIASRRMKEMAPELAAYLALSEEQAPMQYLAAELLAEWGYREGIEWMIEWVDSDDGEGARMFAITPLGRACGVNFFSDKARWRKWWAENREHFPSARTDESNGH